MSAYLDRFVSTTGANRSIARLAPVLGAASVSSSSSLGEFVNRMRAEAAGDVDDGVGTLVGAAAGAIYGYKHNRHWLLGAIAGASLGRNVPALISHPHERAAALRNMGVTGVACAASLALPTHPAAGFAIGFVGAELVSRLWVK